MNQLASVRIFTKVADCLNFAEAAKQLGISNSVVTRSVAVLEQHLSVRLVNRTTRRVSLTPAGQLYREHCGELLRRLAAMDECMAAAAGQPAGSLRIAASSLYASTDLPEVLAAYRVQEQRTQFDLTVFDNTPMSRWQISMYASAPSATCVIRRWFAGRSHRRGT
ncbi:LysR family transcriptional regulator [Paraburkholderia sp. MM5384-R2]|uniref:LysR family transcriptional regulator n=1 Tax=Paraburkholderia sp. MM5384-R2 TaxID=2723097 RepID=UPI00160EB91C|nr:LysR family transcriptional regulator [Paraburkholderia sp. MM5384-R2]MBB5500003.1 DNA-binding transcriptional LysR family regulator [Paraburkholderia sp. MM5384-R2]